MNKKRLNRFSELSEQARSKFIENSDFEPCDWIETEDLKEFSELQEEYFKSLE
jgi:hypothetical protein